MLDAPLPDVSLLASAALFAVGSQIEGHTETGEAKPAPAESQQVATSPSQAARRPQSEAAGGDRKSAETGTASGEARTSADTGDSSDRKQGGESDKHGKSSGDRDAGDSGDGAKDSDNADAAKDTGSRRSAETGSATADTADSADAAEPGSSETAAERRSGSSETAVERRSEIHKEAKLFGINPEAVGLVIAAVLASVLLALAVWLWPITLVYIAALAFGLVFAGFDVREILHQIDELRAALIAIAAVLAVLHLLVAILAGSVLLRARTGSVRPRGQTA